MLPACAPFYMGLAAGWGVLVSKYVEHSGDDLCLSATQLADTTQLSTMLLYTVGNLSFCAVALGK